MAERKISSGQDIPGRRKYHWWYDTKAAGVNNTPPTPNYIPGKSPELVTNPGESCPPRFDYTHTPNFSILSQSPPSTGDHIESSNRNVKTERRDSLKNLALLSDNPTFFLRE